MVLRNGKEVVKEGAGSVEGNAPVSESGEQVTTTNSTPQATSMEVDDEGANVMSSQESSVHSGIPAMVQNHHANPTTSITAEDCRRRVNDAGEQLELLYQEQAQLFSRMTESGGNATTQEDEHRFNELTSQIGRLKTVVSYWDQMLENMNLITASRARSVPTVGLSSASSLSGLSKGLNGGDGTMDDKQIILLPGIPRYHRKVPDHEMPKVDPKTSGPIRTSVRLFLYEFRTQGNLTYGSKNFEKICYRLLALANMDVKVQDALTAAREKDKGPAWSWDKCEQVFVDCAMTLHEKTSEVEEFARIGREKTESFKEYELRLRRLVEVYRVNATGCTQHCIMQMLRPGSRKYYSNSIGSLV